MKKLLDDINDHDRANSERKNIYADYYKDEDLELGTANFRVDLLKHLAGSIVIKEHRVRYQKEQFDRFVTSTKAYSLQKKSMTLREFCNQYARLIDTMTQSSHYFKCPKIEANYDDFAKETVLPINPAIFYYFFSSNRSGRTWAQWMLAAVRYPNSKTRRAYMRFFS